MHHRFRFVPGIGGTHCQTITAIRRLLAKAASAPMANARAISALLISHLGNSALGPNQMHLFLAGELTGL